MIVHDSPYQPDRDFKPFSACFSGDNAVQCYLMSRARPDELLYKEIISMLYFDVARHRYFT